VKHRGFGTVDHTCVWVEVGTAVDAMSVAFRKNTRAEGRGDDLWCSIFSNGDPGSFHLLLASTLPTDGTGEIPEESFLGLDLGRDNVLLPFDQFSYEIWVHGFEHGETVAMEVGSVHSDYH